MARGMNRAMIIGFVEREPEMRTTSGGQQVASLTVSVSRQWTTSMGETRETTEWLNIVGWGNLAEAACQRLQQNQRIYAEGHLETRSWEDTGGQRHSRTELVADKLIPLDNRDTIPEEDLHSRNKNTPPCLNRVMLIGNLGRDPEMRYTPGGQAVTSFSLAATQAQTTGNSGWRGTTEWFNIVSWGSLAEICNEYLTKGRRVYVEAEMRTRGWEQPDGSRHYRSELVANEMIMLGPRPVSDGVQRTPRFSNKELPA